MDSMWKICAQVTRKDGSWSCSTGAPTFYLDGAVSAESVIWFATKVVDPHGTAESVYIGAWRESDGTYVSN